MLLTKYNNMIKAVPSDRADEPLTIAILPWRSRRGWPIPNAHRPKTPDKDIVVDAVPIDLLLAISFATAAFALILDQIKRPVMAVFKVE